jgi:ADP-heptose:LPS heptosyltransferase
MKRPRVLVVRFSAIGDCVMSVPVAASVRRAMPSAEIWWAVESRCTPVIDTDRLVDVLHVVPRDVWKKRRWSPSTWRSQILTYAKLREVGFDCGIDLQGHSKTALCLRVAAPHRRIAAYATDSLAARLNPRVPGRRGNMHAIEWAMEALSHIGPFDKGVEFVMPDVESEARQLRPMLAGEGPLVTIAVGAGAPRKIYPIARWRTVAQRLMAGGARVAFLGGTGDPPPDLEGAVDLVGKLPLRSTMAAVAISKLHLAGDTGSGHIAAAYRVPVVSVFGSMDPANYRPYTAAGIVLREGSEASCVPTGSVIEAAEAALGIQETSGFAVFD